MLTQARLQAELSLDLTTGGFTRRHSRRRWKKGEQAGCLTPSGYLVVRVLGKAYLAHRLVWLYVHGAFPKESLDHIDGVRTNNRPENLREANHAENNQNRHGPHGDTETGVLGVTVLKRGTSWRAKICIEGKQKHLGVYPSLALAEEAYLLAKRTYHPFSTI